jgi:hypothetical protein
MQFEGFDPKPVFKRFDRLIGDGEVGGKARGLAFSHEVITGSSMEEHVDLPDINYAVTTEVFQDYIEENRIGKILEEARSIKCEDSEETALTLFKKMTVAFHKGQNSDSFDRSLEKILTNIGDVPLAIRSSSLLEDSKRLAFAGKYSTCFSANVGTMEERRERLSKCIKKVWASLYNPAARAYRIKHGFSDSDEAMGVVIQPVIGHSHGCYYYPEIAGTVFSKVYRRPSTRIRKEDGVMRLCFGMGTRSVDRLKARLFYLSHPALRPQGNLPLDIAQTSQVKFDFFDRQKGKFMSGSISDYLPFILKEHKLASAFIEVFSDNLLTWAGSEKAKTGKPIFSFSSFPQRHPFFFKLVRELAAHMEESMGMPADMEFAYDTSTRKLCILQLRPLASYEEMAKVRVPAVPQEKIILKGNKMVSNGRLENATHIVYVDYNLYGKDSRYFEVAREIGRINEKLSGSRYILVGPGRWGSTNPLLGVPVKYNEISNCGCLVEVGISHSDFVPELSYGTHFFLDLDVDGILYLPVFDESPMDVFNRSWLDSTPYETGRHPAVRVYKGDFSVFLDGDKEIGEIHSS